MSSSFAKSMYAQILASAPSHTASEPLPLAPAHREAPVAPIADPQTPAMGKTEDTALPPEQAFPALLESFRYRYQVDADQTLSPLAPSTEDHGAGQPSVLMRALRDRRIFHGRAFVQQIGQLAGQLPPSAVEHLRGTSHQLSATFSQGFSLNSSVLQQFSRQSRTLAAQGEEALKTYLDATDMLLAQGSGTELNGFFDRVDTLLRSGDKASSPQALLALKEQADPQGSGEPSGP